MLKNTDIKKLTPGEILKIIIESSNITEDDLINYALISKSNLHYIIHGNNLIPACIAIYLETHIGLNIKFWHNINLKFAKEKNINYIGQDLGYEMLFNKIMFEKD